MFVLHDKDFLERNPDVVKLFAEASLDQCCHKHGAEYDRAEVLLYGQKWGFDLSTITCPTKVFAGMTKQAKVSEHQ